MDDESAIHNEVVGRWNFEIIDIGLSTVDIESGIPDSVPSDNFRKRSDVAGFNISFGR